MTPTQSSRMRAEIVAYLIIIYCTSLGERNVHLDLNPWWWAESSTDILTGVDTLSYADPQVLCCAALQWVQKQCYGCNYNDEYKLLLSITARKYLALFE